ncbi:MAG: TrpB-like pyridoxal-phosphate dependent enzyme, partial [Paramuribaculum sp.]|nr:TrpB-like pyridoxal-phosphate dependent enzyme [Paramuribaculum sp.]
PQLESFDAATLFARAEGLIPAPESAHAIAAAIREAKAAKEAGEQRVILFNLSGHGLIDMTSYDRYFAGDLANYQIPDSEIAANVETLEKLI